MTAARGRTTLVLGMTLAVVLAAVGLAPPAQAAAPSNDDFENAEVIDRDEMACNLFTITGRALAEATAQPGEPAHHGSAAQQSIWFTVTPKETGTASIYIPYPQTDAVRAAAYRGETLATLLPLGSSSGSTYGHGFSFQVVAGERITFAVDIAGSIAARVKALSLSLPYPPPENLAPASATVIEGTRGRAPACPGDGNIDRSPELWYRWTAPRTGFTSFSSGYMDALWVYRGVPGDLTLIGQASDLDEEGPEHFRAYADFWAEQGTTYYIGVEPYNDGGQNLEYLTWRPGTDYPNPRADFDRNGCEDMVIGAPGEDASGRNAGAVVVRYGCRDKVQRWHQGNDGTASTPESGDRFGHAVAAGDFDRDGYADLAVGVPGEDVGAHDDAGTVIMLRGSASGLTASGAKRLTQTAASGPLARNESGDRFGWALASRELETPTLLVPGFREITPRQGYSGEWPAVPVPPVTLPASLWIGAPGEDHDGKRNAGTLGVFDRGSLASPFHNWQADWAPYRARSGGLLGSAIATGGLQNFGWPDRLWAVGEPGADFNGKDAVGRVVYEGVEALIIDEDPDAVDVTPRAGDRLGSAIAVVDAKDRNGYPQILVGMPGRDVNGVRDAGMVAEFDGYDNVVYTQDSAGVPGSPTAGDRFGASLAAGFFDTDTKEDLLIGIPGENIGGDNDAGAVTVVYGRGTKTRLHRDSNGIAGDARPGDRFGTTVGGLDIDGDTVDEIVIGAPYDNLSGAENAGSVVLRRRNATSTLFSATLTPGGAEDGDLFGAAVLQ